MAEVKWIKLSTDIFDSRKIKQIESMPDGDSIIIIWLKLLVLAGNTNDSGLVYFTKEVPYTEQMLAVEFNKPLTTIQLALATFQKFGMLDVIDDIFHVSNWEKYQNVERMEKIREQNRLRQKAWYDRQKNIPNVRPNANLTQPNATDKDKDKDKDKDIDNNNNNSATAKTVVELYNSICTRLPKVKSISEARKKAIKARLNIYSLEDIELMFKKANMSDFLCGQNSKNWNATFDWLMKDSNFTKVMDDNYQNKSSQATQEAVTVDENIWG